MGLWSRIQLLFRMKSSAALDRITTSSLPPQLQAEITLLRADLAMARNLPREALDLLQDSSFPALDELAPAQRVHFHEIRANAQFVTGAVLASALERITMDTLLPVASQRSNHDQIWQALGSVPQNQLQSLSANASSDVIRGWYDLALVEGSVTTAHDVERIADVRARSKLLVTIGACATAGGVQALRNLADLSEYRSLVYARPEYLDALATSTPVAAHVPVDHELRGCPIAPGQLLSLVDALLRGRRPDGDRQEGALPGRGKALPQ